MGIEKLFPKKLKKPVIDKDALDSFLKNRDEVSSKFLKFTFFYNAGYEKYEKGLEKLEPKLVKTTGGLVPVYSVEQFADFIGKHKNTIYHWIGFKNFPEPFFFGAFKARYFIKEHLLATRVLLDFLFIGSNAVTDDFYVLAKMMFDKIQKEFFEKYKLIK